MAEAEVEQHTKQRVIILTHACASAEKRYDGYEKKLAALDAKAQAVATVSGLVLAAIAAFSKDGRPPIPAGGGCWWIVLVLTIPVLALAAVIISMWGATVREPANPFDTSSSLLDAEQIASSPSEALEANWILNYYMGQLKRWQACLDGTGQLHGIKHTVNRKGHYVLIGQRLLMLAFVLLILLFGLVLFVSR
jgi:hypothetical protein